MYIKVIGNKNRSTGKAPSSVTMYHVLAISDNIDSRYSRRHSPEQTTVTLTYTTDDISHM